MSEELREALEWFEQFGPSKELLPQAHVLAEHARSWLNLVSEENVAAGVKKVLEAAVDMRRNHISILPSLPFAVSDQDGIQRLELVWAVRAALLAVYERET